MPLHAPPWFLSSSVFEPQDDAQTELSNTSPDHLLIVFKSATVPSSAVKDNIDDLDFLSMQVDQDRRNPDSHVVVPLSLYRKQVTVCVEKHKLLASDYMVKQLRGPWDGMAEVELEFPTPRLLDAFFVAFQCLVDPKSGVAHYRWDRQNEFQVLSSAVLLGVTQLQHKAELAILQHMQPAGLIKSLRLAERFGRELFKRGLFKWMIHSKCLVAGDENPIAQSLHLIQGSGGGGAHSGSPKHKLTCDEHGTLRYKNQSYPLMLFNDYVQEQMRRKYRFFRAGLEVKDLLVERLDDSVDDAERKKKGGFPGMIRGYVERKRNCGPQKDETHFVFRDEQSDNVIIAACITKGGTGFQFAVDYPSRFKRHADDYLAEMKSNFVGTTFTIYDYGCSSAELPPHALPSAMRAEHGAVVYERNVMGRVPNAMTVIVPDPDALTNAAEAGIGIVEKHKNKMNGLLSLKTRPPRWNHRIEAWTMDFKGRVLLASKKNFQLLDRRDPKKILMSFGKVSKHRFSLDFQEPLSCIQAFSVALSSFADKLMVT